MTKQAPFSINDTVRLLGDSDLERTFTLTEIRPVGRTGKQFRCAMICDKTGELYDGIAPSRLAHPFTVHGPKTYTVCGYEFFPQRDSDPNSHRHPAMRLAALLPEIVAEELLRLVTEAAKKGTAKSHIDVVLFCVTILPTPMIAKIPEGFWSRVNAAFHNQGPSPDMIVSYLATLTAKLHSLEGNI